MEQFRNFRFFGLFFYPNLEFFFPKFPALNSDTEQLLTGHHIDDDVTYVIGVNSYEGNQYWSFKEHITYENVTSVFDITNGYEEGME